MAKFDLKAYARQGAAASGGGVEWSRLRLSGVPGLEAKNGDCGCECRSAEATEADVSRAEGGCLI